VSHRQLRNVRAETRRSTGIITHDWTSFDPPLLAEIKAHQRCAVSVCLPARNEQNTIGAIVASIRRYLQEYVALVDELIVIDDGSNDRTASVAAAAGATVVDVESALPGFGPSLGKGDVLWRSLAISTGDIVVWCDSDIITFGPQFVYGLLGPLLTIPDVQFTKACFNRNGDDDMASGRVTELLAKPLLRLLRPELTVLDQPLSGSYAGRRTLLEQLEFEPDFGVEIGLLLDVVDRVGAAAIAQVDIGTFRHPHRTTAQLAPQAASVARAVLRRCPGIDIDDAIDLLRLDNGHSVDVSTIRRPPLSQLRTTTRTAEVRPPNRRTQ
jgi:glucosyl-3-phosphoglycerate synthase